MKDKLFPLRLNELLDAAIINRQIAFYPHVAF